MCVCSRVGVFVPMLSFLMMACVFGCVRVVGWLVVCVIVWLLCVCLGVCVGLAVGVVNCMCLRVVPLWWLCCSSCCVSCCFVS